MENNPETPTITTNNVNTTGRCKSIMNVIRRVISFRGKSRQEQPIETGSFEENHVEQVEQPTVKKLRNMQGILGFDFPCTSNFNPDSPSVYEDAFVAVSRDGFVHIKHYYTFYPRAEFHIESIHIPEYRRFNRVVPVSRILTVFYAAGPDCKDETVCKSWGICNNNVWWASHLNRMEAGNVYTNVILHDESPLRAGFSVMNIEGFAEALQYVGLDKEAPFQQGIPSPPVRTLQIPFIDDDVEEIKDTCSREGTSSSCATSTSTHNKW